MLYDGVIPFPRRLLAGRVVDTAGVVKGVRAAYPVRAEADPALGH